MARFFNETESMPFFCRFFVVKRQRQRNGVTETTKRNETAISKNGTALHFSKFESFCVCAEAEWLIVT